MNLTPRCVVDSAISVGKSTKEIVKKIKNESSFSKNEIYEYVINFKWELLWEIIKNT